jgi:nucleotide-binding universal stress UspA family protein
MVSKAPHAYEHPLPAPYIVLVGLDLSEPGGRAWRFAFDLAALKGDDSEVHAVIVGTRALAPRVRDLATPGVSTAPRGAEEAIALPPLKVLQHRSAGGQARLMAMHFRTGRPDRAVVQLAKEIGADVIVVATQETTRWQRLLGGSTADRIARCAPCPVVVVRPKTDADDPGLSEYGAD